MTPIEHMDHFDRLREFVRLVEVAKKLQKSEASPETIFDVIFSDAIGGRIRKLGLGFKWHDPDGSYEEDVRAYVDAMTAKAAEYKKILDALAEAE